MPRLTALLLALVAAVALAAPAGAQTLPGSDTTDTFHAILRDGRLVQFDASSPTALTRPRSVPGVAAGDRIIALSRDFALGVTGRLYRLEYFDRVVELGPRVALRGTSYSLVTTAGGVRVLSDAGLDVTVDLTTGAQTAGSGLALADGTRIAPSVAALSDGRLTGVEPRRGTLVTETAPGSGVMTELRLRQDRGELRFAQPIAFALTNDRIAYAISGLPDQTRILQSKLLRIDLATGAVAGDAGPYFYRQLRAFLHRGIAIADRVAPRAQIVDAPRRVSIRQLRRDRAVSLRVRCSEACIVNAGTAVGGRTNMTTSASRDTAGIVRVAFFRLTKREERLLRARIGKTAIFRVFVQDWKQNQVVLERRFRLTR